MMPCEVCGRYHEPDEPCRPAGLAGYYRACQDAVDALAASDDEAAWGDLALERGWLDAAQRHYRRAGTAKAQYRQALWVAERAL